VAKDEQFDVAVIGAGVGGMCTAALLAHRGFKVLLVEKLSYLGGRFSNTKKRGFLCSTGGVAVQMSGPIGAVCDEVGVDPGFRPSRRIANWIDGKFYDMPAGGGALRKLICEVASGQEEATVVMEALNKAFTVLEPTDAISFKDWLSQYTDNPRIHGVFHATISSLLTVNMDELPAAEYFKLMKNIAPLQFGYVTGGNVTMFDKLGAVVTSNGGTVHRKARVRKIIVEDGAARGVEFDCDGETVSARAKTIVSNMDPRMTVDLAGPGNFEASYRAFVDENIVPTKIIWIHFSSPVPLCDYDAVAASCARRVNMIDCPSLECPEFAPEGQHLYIAGAAPISNTEEIDMNEEVRLALEDLRDILPGFEDHAEIISISKFQGKWPGFRTLPGNPVSIKTPIRGLYNVGDGAAPRGFAGSMGAARSAQLAADEIASFLKPLG